MASFNPVELEIDCANALGVFIDEFERLRDEADSYIDALTKAASIARSAGYFWQSWSCDAHFADLLWSTSERLIAQLRLLHETRRLHAACIVFDAFRLHDLIPDSVVLPLCSWNDDVRDERNLPLVKDQFVLIVNGRLLRHGAADDVGDLQWTL